MTIEQNLPGKMETIISLANFWRENLSEKPTITSNEGETREWKGIESLLSEFSNFANNYEKLLGEAPANRYRFTLNKGAEQILQNFNILSRVCEQRTGKVTNDSLAFFLSQAEDILESYCNRWLSGNQRSRTEFVTLQTPVAYFEKLYGIKRAIYAPDIPVISIPLSEYNQPNRWLALAHEIGHHIFWNALKSLSELNRFQINLAERLEGVRKGNPANNPWIGWGEEVFADVCATLLVGPDYVVSCQELAAEQIRNKDDFAKNDSEHPSFYLRPLITEQVLREIAQKNNNEILMTWLDMVGMRWRNFISVADDLECQGTGIKLSVLSKDVNAVCRVMLESQVWPNNFKLLDLIEYYGKDGLSKAEEKELKKHLQSPPLPFPVTYEFDETKPLLEKIPETMREIWDFLTKDLNKPATWNTLLEMRIDDTHTHANPHEDCQFHLLHPLAGLHKHNPDTRERIPC